MFHARPLHKRLVSVSYSTEELAESGMRNHFMETAVRLALENVRSGQGGPFAAVVVGSGKVIGRGTNRVVLENDPTSHAEMNAIREACRSVMSFRLAGCDIYCSCEPCPMCLGAIYWARLERVFFAASAAEATAAGFDDVLIHNELIRPIYERRLPQELVQCEGALDPFKAWAQKVDRVLY